MPSSTLSRSAGIALAITLPVSPLAAADPDLLGEWSTCYVSTSLNACASLRMLADPFGGHPNSFVAILEAPGAYPIGVGAFRVTAWGFYHPGNPVTLVEWSTTEDGWGIVPQGWESFPFAIGTQYWEAALGGPVWGAEGFWGHWEGGAALSSLRFAWRGVLQDQSSSFDCIQRAPGDSQCVSVAPEPSTWAMLLTGMTALLLALRKRRHRAMDPD